MCMHIGMINEALPSMNSIALKNLLSLGQTHSKLCVSHRLQYVVKYGLQNQWAIAHRIFKKYTY